MNDDDFDTDEIGILTHPIPTPESMIKSKRGKIIILSFHLIY